ncbi:vascular endothelial growth factor receptor 1 isoform X2 [Cavia porcellus]|uniref:vascular endothelial growth factor receptor 1 isoform X2 n=1 Tax=Cavia porcellus TaxID=10141 RepID=UPI000C87CD0C|nr:vascular endothelial growth factor receptor 1 isoform X2 [Cavia porcellus]
MVRCWDTGVLLCALLGCLLLPGPSSGSTLKSPELNLKGTQHVLQAGQTLTLKCRTEAPHSWTFPKILRKDKRLSIIKSACETDTEQFCSTLTLNSAHANQTGFYSCKYLPSAAPKGKQTESKIYVFVNDANQPFVEMHHDIPEVLYLTEGEELIIPCRVSSPDINVVLQKFPQDILVPDGKKIIWDSRKGFIITNATYREIGLLICETKIDGHSYSSTYLTHRPSNIIMNVQMGPANPVKLLRGHPLTLNCTATAALNTRVQIIWNYPGKKTGRATIRQRIDQSDPLANVFHSVLTIPKVQRNDRGLYACHVKSGPSAQSANTTVQVYGKAFISVKHRKKNVYETTAGEQSFELSVKVNAFPQPEVLWLKDGLPATTRSARYLPHGYSLIIKDVTPEDAGIYKILLSIKRPKMFKSFTVTLIVNVKPEIYENALSSFPEPNLYPLGSKQSLTCTVSGVPQPTVQWFWQPCDHFPFMAGSDLCSTSEESFLLNSRSNVDNRIESITQRMAKTEEMNKMASTLVVADARVSGIYSCVASNKIGTVKRNIIFYVTDVPNGFHINLEKMPVEGEDLKLSCTVNKFLYTNITWILLRTVNNRTIHHSISKQKTAITGERSITLHLVIRNASLEDSGTYACRARNVHTGEETLQKTEVIIRGSEEMLLSK